MKLHPEFITKNGKKEFAVIPYEEFSQMTDLIEDYEDLKELRKAKKKERLAKTKTLDEIREELV